MSGAATDAFAPRAGGWAAFDAALSRALFITLLTVPWLWAWTPGPSAQVMPLLAAWVCSALAGLLWAAVPAVRQHAVADCATSWVAAAALSSAMGLLQWFGWAAPWPGVSVSGVGEAYGNLRQRNQFATLTSVGLAALLWWNAQRPQPHQQPRRRQRAALLLGLAVLLALGNAASLSRTGLLQWLLVAGVGLLHAPSRRLAATAGVAYAAATVALPWALFEWRGVGAADLLMRLTHEYGCSSRRVLWSNVLQLIAERPWWGWGWGELDYAHFATLYPGDRFCGILDNAHNLPLHLAVELGVPVAVLACTVLLVWVVRAAPWRERDATRAMAWGVLAVMGLHSLLEYPLWYGPFQLAVLLAVAMLWPPMWQARSQGVAGCWALGVGCAAALAACTWAGVAYHQVSQAYLPPEARQAARRDDPFLNVHPGPFAAQMQFAQLSTLPLNRRTAAQVHALSLDLLHFSPEPRVIEAAIESAVMLGRDEESLWLLVRYRAAFADDYRAWARGHAR